MKVASNNHKAIIGVILAGGKSTRMGTDKALLQINEQSMIDRTVKILRQTSVDKVVISRNSSLPSVNENSPPHINDIIPDKGPLSGIHSVATKFEQSNLMVVPVDLPFIDSDTIQQLIDCAIETNQNVRFVGDNLPLFLQNTEQLRQTLEATLNHSQSFSVARLCAQFPIVELQNQLKAKTFNANTPEQWHYAKQHLSNAHSADNKEVF